MEFNKIKKVHLVGDQGISMQGIRKVLEVRGPEVSGCDIATTGHKVSHITKDLDLVLYSSAITPQSAGFKELVAAREQGIMVQKRAWLLGRFMQEKGRFGIAVAGMHGKSTTTAMLGKILVVAGYDPMILGGAVMKDYNDSVKIPSSKFQVPNKIESSNDRLSKSYVVVEADEYDRSFLALVPKAAIITNIEEEHLDTYPKGLPQIIRAFREFVKLIPMSGILVVNADDPNCQSVVKSARCRVKFFSLKKPWPGLKLRVPGQHNLLNATAAARLAHELDVPSKTIQQALNTFSGLKRRFEYKGEVNGAVVIDDYAHHPTEIKAVLATARYVYPDRRLIVLFQPHQFLRTKQLLDRFKDSFAEADQLYIADIFEVKGRDNPSVISTESFIKAINHRSVVGVGGDYSKISRVMVSKLQPGDLFLTIGAAPIDQVADRLVKLA